MDLAYRINLDNFKDITSVKSLRFVTSQNILQKNYIQKSRATNKEDLLLNNKYLLSYNNTSIQPLEFQLLKNLPLEF
jgi:hypothetical protein